MAKILLPWMSHFFAYSIHFCNGGLGETNLFLVHSDYLVSLMGVMIVGEPQEVFALGDLGSLQHVKMRDQEFWSCTSSDS